MGKAADLGATHKLYQMYYNVCGYLPPVNNIGYHERGSAEVDDSHGIKDTHAVFQGIKRPHIDENGDKSVFVYITKPRFIYKYRPGMVCVVARHPFPAGAVFAMYLKIDEEKKTGEVFNWELVKCSAQEPMFPEDYKNRYDQPRWRL